MKKIKRFLFNASLMVLTTVFLRILSLWFSVYLSRTVGEEGLGLYSLTSSVYRLGITLSSAGIGFAATRIIAEELEKKNPREAARAAGRCLFTSMVFGTVIALVFFLFAKPISAVFLGDIRTAASIRMMSVSFPFIVMSGIINAYFTAVGRMSGSALPLLLDQFIRMGVTYLMLLRFDGINLEYACLSLIVGGIFAEVISFALSYLFYSADIKKLCVGQHRKTHLARRVSYIALPVAISSVIRTGLHSIEHMMIPSGLRKRGVDQSRALGLYGMITGMVFPVIMFPSAFLYAASDLLIPEFAACNASGDTRRLKRLTSKVMQLTSYFAVGVSGIIFGFANEIGQVFYNSGECALYIKILAPLIVFMLYDHLADAILKGLGEQVSVVKYNIVDSVASVLLVWILVPLFGLGGYVFVVWFGEVLNCIMSSLKLMKRTAVPFRFMQNFCLPTLAATLSVVITRTVMSALHGAVATTLFTLIVAFAVSALIYLLILRIMGCVTLNDYRLLKKAFSKA